MGFFHTCIFHSHRQHKLIIYLLLLCSWTQEKFMVEGRALIKLSEASEVGLMGDLIQMREEEEERVIMRSQIGSMPPRCERIYMCSKCAHCEAVQVPVVPKDKKSNKESRNLSKYFSTITSSRYPYGYDYKPMRWKCKCGDTLYNP